MASSRRGLTDGEIRRYEQSFFERESCNAMSKKSVREKFPEPGGRDSVGPDTGNQRIIKRVCTKESRAEAGATCLLGLRNDGDRRIPDSEVWMGIRLRPYSERRFDLHGRILSAAQGWFVEGQPISRMGWQARQTGQLHRLKSLKTCCKWVRLIEKQRCFNLFSNQAEKE